MPRVGRHHGAASASPRVCPSGRAADDDFEGQPSFVCLLQKVVQGRLVSMNPRRGQHLVEEATAETNTAMQTPVLIERVERLRVAFQPTSELGVCTAAQVLAHRRFVAKRPADSTRALNEKRRRNPEGSASAIELEGFLWRAEVCNPPFSPVHPPL